MKEVPIPVNDPITVHELAKEQLDAAEAGLEQEEKTLRARLTVVRKALGKKRRGRKPYARRARKASKSVAKRVRKPRVKRNALGERLKKDGSPWGKRGPSKKPPAE